MAAFVHITHTLPGVYKSYFFTLLYLNDKYLLTPLSIAFDCMSWFGDRVGCLAYNAWDLLVMEQQVYGCSLF